MRVSIRVAKLLQRLGYSRKCIDEYWLFDDSLHSYLEGDMNGIKPEYRISAPNPYEALSWLWEKGEAYINLKSKRNMPCICSASITRYPKIEIEIAGSDPDSAIYNCLELIARQYD